MASFEDQIRALVAAGNLTHIGAYSRSDGKGWNATFTPAKGFGSHFAVADDPVKAMQEAMAQVKTRKPRTPVSKPDSATPDVDRVEAAARKSDDLDFG